MMTVVTWSSAFAIPTVAVLTSLEGMITSDRTLASVSASCSRLAFYCIIFPKTFDYSVRRPWVDFTLEGPATSGQEGDTSAHVFKVGVSLPPSFFTMLDRDWEPGCTLVAALTFVHTIKNGGSRVVPYGGACKATCVQASVARPRAARL